MKLEYWGVNSPDLYLKWNDFIEIEEEVVEIVQKCWNSTTNSWDSDDDSDEFEEEGEEEISSLEIRAMKSIALVKRALNPRESKLRKNDSDSPQWVIRVWFYLSMNSEEKIFVKNLEDVAEKKKYEKDRKKKREKLFKRLGTTKRRRFK